jgi:hypothetical protein
MDNFIIRMPKIEKKIGGMEWCKPCISEGINRIWT